jgi:hypothetical protein
MTKYIYFFSKLFPLEETSVADTSSSEVEFKPFMINKWFINYSDETNNFASMVRDTPFTVPIKNGQKFRYQLVQFKLDEELEPSKQSKECNLKITELLATKFITPSIVYNLGFEILADFIYTADEINPTMNYQGFEITFKYCIIPEYRSTVTDTDTDSVHPTEEQLYMTHPFFKWPKV